MPKLKNSNVTFWVIFKHCAYKVDLNQLQVAAKGNLRRSPFFHQVQEIRAIESHFVRQHAFIIPKVVHHGLVHVNCIVCNVKFETFITGMNDVRTLWAYVKVVSIE